MIDIERLTRRRCEVTVDYDGETITVGYNSRIRSAQWLSLVRRAQQAEAPDEQAEALAAAVAHVLLDWDVLARAPEEGEAVEYYPVTMEALLPLDIELLAAVLDAVAADMLPNAPTPAS